MTDEVREGAGDLPSPSRSGRERLVQLLFGLLIAGLAVMWIYAWVFAPRGDPDRISDQAWADDAAQRCDLAREVLAAVRLEAPNVAERADDVDAVSDALASMVTDLGEVPPNNDDDADTVTRWLDDYETYIADRREFTAALRQNPSTVFEMTAREKRQISTVIDRYADVNGMQSCMTPADIN